MLIAALVALVTLVSVPAFAGDLFVQVGNGGFASVSVYAAPGGFAGANIDTVQGGDGGNGMVNFSAPYFSSQDGFGASFGGNGGGAHVGFSAGKGGSATGNVEEVFGGDGGDAFGAFQKFEPYGGGKG